MSRKCESDIYFPYVDNEDELMAVFTLWTHLGQFEHFNHATRMTDLAGILTLW